MKTLIRIFLVLLVLSVVAALAGYVVVTRPAFQKRLVQSQLPEGSSVQFVKVSARSLELTNLNLQLSDGSRAKLEHLRGEFSLMAALFDNTIRLRGLEVDGLVVRLPEVVTSSAEGEVTAVEPTSSHIPAPRETSDSSAEQAGAPTDVLYEMGELELLFDIDSIQINGALIDASRNRYTFELQSDAIAPGQSTQMSATLQLESQQALQGGLKNFSSNMRLSFTQKESGGFEQINLDSQTLGSDANGDSLLAVSQTLELTINGFEESANVALSFNAELPHPELFAPELIALQGLSLQGELQGSAKGSALVLKTADLDATANGRSVATVNLKQSLTLGAEQKFTGELMQVELIELPLAWVNPWLSNGIQITGAPVSTQIVLSGESDGALQGKLMAPLQLGPLSLAQGPQALLQEVSLRMNPVMRVEADQTLHYDLGDFQLLDRYGAIIRGSLRGRQSGLANSSPDASPLAGIQAEASFELGLADLLQQPALAGIGSVLAGQAQVDLDLDGAAEYPAQIKALITGLRARELPGAQQDYRFAAQLKQSNAGDYSVESSFQAGSESRPSTNIQLDGQANPELLPLPFKLQLTGPKVLQADLDLLMAALQSDVTTTTSMQQSDDIAKGTDRTAATSVSSIGMSEAPVDDSRLAQVAGPPPWADLDGEVTILIDSLILDSGQTITGLNAQAKITEALLELSDLAATLEGGNLSGQAQVVFDPRVAAQAYQLRTELSFKDIDPAIFSKKSFGSFPVQGLFDGNFKLTGSGASLEAALEDSAADLLVTGREGVLTAFELDERSQLGLIGASILGQSLDRPGITAMAEAVPYFKNMRFSNFTLQLSREQDKKVRIPELSFVGDNLLINGAGVIAASSLSEVLSQPLELTLGLGAKGRLIDYLETLQLLSSNTDADGFRQWNQDINISGSLGDPNTSALKNLLNNAARRALSQGQQTSPASDTNSAQPAEGEQLNTEPKEKEKSKDEKRRKDIEMGLDLLNSAFG